MSLLRRSLLVVLPAILALGSAAAGTVSGLTTYHLEWSGESLGNTARATGLITIDTDLLSTPGDYFQDDTPFATAFSIQILGASNGNGGFTLDDFTDIRFDPGGVTLDFSTELVGQDTSEDPWGLSLRPGGSAGDFNLFSENNLPGQMRPSGTWYFELSAGGAGGDQMLLTSFRPVPEPSGALLVALGTAFALRVRARRRLSS